MANKNIDIYQFGRLLTQAIENFADMVTTPIEPFNLIEEVDGVYAVNPEYTKFRFQIGNLIAEIKDSPQYEGVPSVMGYSAYIAGYRFISGFTYDFRITSPTQLEGNADEYNGLMLREPAQDGVFEDVKIGLIRAFTNVLATVGQLAREGGMQGTSFDLNTAREVFFNHHMIEANTVAVLSGNYAHLQMQIPENEYRILSGAMNEGLNRALPILVMPRNLDKEAEYLTDGIHHATNNLVYHFNEVNDVAGPTKEALDQMVLVIGHIPDDRAELYGKNLLNAMHSLAEASLQNLRSTADLGDGSSLTEQTPEQVINNLRENIETLSANLSEQETSLFRLFGQSLIVQSSMLLDIAFEEGHKEFGDLYIKAKKDDAEQNLDGNLSAEVSATIIDAVNMHHLIACLDIQGLKKEALLDTSLEIIADAEQMFKEYGAENLQVAYSGDLKRYAIDSMNTANDYIALARQDVDMRSAGFDELYRKELDDIAERLEILIKHAQTYEINLGETGAFAVLIAHQIRSVQYATLKSVQEPSTTDQIYPTGKGEGKIDISRVSPNIGTQEQEGTER